MNKDYGYCDDAQRGMMDVGLNWEYDFRTNIVKWEFRFDNGDTMAISQTPDEFIGALAQQREFADKIIPYIVHHRLNPLLDETKPPLKVPDVWIKAFED